jgi:hypothetical protein
MKVDLFMEVHHKDDARHIAAARATLKTRVGAMSVPRRRTGGCLYPRET